MAILKVDTITSADTPTVSITDGASISGVTTFSSDINIADKIVHTGDTDTAIRFPGTDIFTVETGGTERLRVDSAGLKITDKLIHFGDTDTFLEFGTDTITLDTAGSERLRITSDGKVGIGIASPTELLEVNSTGASTAIEISAGEASTTTGESKIVLRSLHSASGTTYSRSEIGSLGVAGGDSDLIFRTCTDNNGPQEQMRITYEGKVGIGTDNPQVRLTVSSDSPAVCDIHHIDGGTNDEARIILGALAANPPSNRGAGIAALNNGAGHDLLIKCSASHSAGPTEKVRVKSSGGITFNGDTASANALDDYEEGSFTAAAYEGGSAITLNYHNTHGRYTKVGNMVTVWMWVRASGTTTSTGGMQIGGLPFASNADSYRPALMGRAYGLANFSGNSGLCFWMNGSSSVIEVVTIDGNGLAASSNTSNNVWASGAEVHCTFSYFV